MLQTYNKQFTSSNSIIMNLAIIDLYCRKYSIEKYAQSAGENIGSEIFNGVKDEILSNIDKNNILGSIIENFMIPGIMWRIWWPLGAIYEVGKLLGFDYDGFWRAIYDGFKSIISGAVSSGKTLSEEDIQNNAQSIFSNAVQSHFQDRSATMNQSDSDKIQELAPILWQYVGQTPDLNKAEANIRKQFFIKNAGIFSSIFSGVSKFLFKWLGKAFIASLLGAGIVSAVGAGKGLLGISPSSPNGQKSSTDTEPGVSVIPITDNAESGMYEVHMNNLDSIWIVDGSPAEVPAVLMQWVLTAYPKLSSYSKDIESSTAFRSMINKFRNRNGFSKDYEFFIVPAPYEQKAQIVSEIANGFIKEHMQELS